MKPQIPSLMLLLKEACDTFGYKWSMTDNYSNSLVEVSNGKKSFFMSNAKIGVYPLNPSFSSKISIDKAYTYMILDQKGYKIPKGDYFFITDEYREKRGDGKERGDIMGFINNSLGGFPVFIKPNSSSLGNFAEIIKTQSELDNYIERVSKNHFMIIVQEIIKIPEYRVFIIDGEIQFAYRKVDVNNIGKANISAGGQIHDYTEIFSIETQKWAQKITHDFSTRVCGIDIFASNGIDDPEGFILIEMNSSPSLMGICSIGKKEKALKIRKKILKKYFD